MSVSLEMNLLSAVILLVSFWISLMVLGDAISSRARTFSGFAFILLWGHYESKNFPEATPKTHLLGFNFIWYCLSVANVSLRLSR